MQDLTFVIGEDRAVAELWEALGSMTTPDINQNEWKIS